MNNADGAAHPVGVSRGVTPGPEDAAVSSPINPILAFTIVMLVWTISDFVAKKTKSPLSSLFVASIIFLIGFLTGFFPEDLLASSSLLGLAGVVVGFIIVHLAR
ncbi:MAG: hypothetical protein ABI112_16980 [Terracoccus sp.]